MNKKKPPAATTTALDADPKANRVPDPPPHVIPPAADAPPPEVNPEATGPQTLTAALNGKEFMRIMPDRETMMIDWVAVNKVAVKARDGHQLSIEEIICLTMYLVREQFR